MSQVKIRNAANTAWITVGGGVEIIQQDSEPGVTYPGQLWLDTDEPVNHPAAIEDDDQDTYVTCEKTADVDKVHVYTGGIERAVFDAGVGLTLTGTVRSSAGLQPCYEIGSGSAFITLGALRTASGYAYIDLIGDTTYTGYGLRLLRDNTGANASSTLFHRGTGDLVLQTVDTADLVFKVGSTERYRITPDGTVTRPNNPSMRAEVGTTQTGMSSGGYHIIEYDTEHHDQGNDYDPVTNHRFTAPEDGKYLVVANHLYTATTVWSSNSFFSQMHIYKNGSSEVRDRRYCAPNATSRTKQTSVHAIIELDANDYIDIRVYQNTGNTLTGYAGEYSTLSIDKVQ